MPASLVIFCELDQIPVGVSEVDAPHLAASAMPSHWPELDGIALALDFRFRHVQAPVEDQAKVEAAISRMLCGRKELGLSRVDVELLTAEADGIAPIPLVELHAEDVDIEVQAGIYVLRRDDDVVDILESHSFLALKRIRT